MKPSRKLTRLQLFRLCLQSFDSSVHGYKRERSRPLQTPGERTKTTSAPRCLIVFLTAVANIDGNVHPRSLRETLLVLALGPLDVNGKCPCKQCGLFPRARCRAWSAHQNPKVFRGLPRALRRGRAVNSPFACRRPSGANPQADASCGEVDASIFHAV